MSVAAIGLGLLLGLVAVAIWLALNTGRQPPRVDVFDPALMGIAFSSGTLRFGEESLSFIVKEVGPLEITTGELVADDPFVSEEPPFSRRVPIGMHPVSLAVARFGRGGEALAYARVEFSTATIARWVAGVRHGPEPADLSHVSAHAYSAVSGAGCFMDDAAATLLHDKLQVRAAADSLAVVPHGALDAWGWVLKPDPQRPESAVCFLVQGPGDGESYPSYFGLSENGDVVAIVTDFLVLARAQRRALRA